MSSHPPQPANPPAPLPVPLPTREGYDRWAALYDDDLNPLIALENTIFPDLIGDVRGKDLLDVGCGTGRHSIPLAAGGARATGIDFSEGMLSRARAKPGAERVRFIAHDLHTRLPLEDASFDVVLCCLVLDHIADLDHLFAEFARLCRPDGIVVITSMHPAMMLRGVQARFKDPERPGKIHIESVPNEICDFVNAANRAGLRIERMDELKMTDALVPTHPRAEPYVGWPMLLTMRLRHAR